jgi:hypothetical protein
MLKFVWTLVLGHWSFAINLIIHLQLPPHGRPRKTPPLSATWQKAATAYEINTRAKKRDE